jgi:hypothetical protein
MVIILFRSFHEVMILTKGISMQILNSVVVPVQVAKV